MRRTKQVETHRQPVDYETRLIGFHATLSLHIEFKDAARAENMSQKALLKELVIKHLDERINSA